MSPLAEVAQVFLRLGCTAFGGPAAHLALMEREVVQRRGWVTHAELLDLIGAANLIPGPNSTEVALHLGHRRAGWPGLLIAGFCFIMPSTILTAALAHAYVTYGTRPDVARGLIVLELVILYVVAQAIVRLTRTAIKSRRHAALAAFSVALLAAGVDELATLIACGGAALLVLPRGPTPARPAPYPEPVAGGAPLAPLLATPALAGIGSGALFLYFLKIGSILYGSGYVLIAFLRADLVGRWHWLTEAQLVDMVALGQLTPGPLSSTATAIGWLLAGPAGAAAATAGMFLPAFMFVACSGWLVPRLRSSPTAAVFLDGVNLASLVLMTWAAALLIP